MVTTRDLEWAAGFMEGEGCFDMAATGQIRARATQVQRWPLDRLQALFGGAIPARPAWSHGQANFEWMLCGGQAAGLAMTLYSLLSPRRKEQVVKALTTWRSTRGNPVRIWSNEAKRRGVC